MTDRTTRSAPAAEVDDHDSRDYWDLFFEQIGRRNLVKVALALLALLYASAIYAPLIANERPYFLEAVDHKAYEGALRTLAPISEQVASMVAGGEAAYLARRPTGVAIGYGEALENEADAARARVLTMRASLAPSDRDGLDALLGAIDAGVAAATGGTPSPGGAAAITAAAATVASTYHAADPRQEGSVGLTLRSRTSLPLLTALHGLEVFFMAAWAALLSWPVWNRAVNTRWLGGNRARIRRARRGKWAAVLGGSAVLAGLWHIAIYEPITEVSAKEGLSSGEIVARRVLYPPIAYGFAETHLAEGFRPPTWFAGAEMDENGYYTRGFRVPRPDALTGYLPPSTPIDVRYAEPKLNSPWRHPLGTDGSGRDLLVRMLWGGRVSLAIGIVSALILAVIGTIIGAAAGYYGGAVDMALSRVIDVIIAVPAMYLVVMAAAFVDPDVLPPIFAIVLIIAFVYWTGIARLARAEFLRLREAEFVLASRALGDSAARTMFRHVLPNALGPILVATAFSVAAGILTESSVSYLGFGIQHPMPSWGALINESKSADQWWIQVFPGLMIFLTVTCYNIVGEGIRDALDPKMKVVH